MVDDVKKQLHRFPNVKQMLERIPEEIWDIFLPRHIAGLQTLEMRVAGFKRREHDRDQVIALQRLCGMPLRPNDSLAATKAKARIQGKKNTGLFEKFKNNNTNDSDDFTSDSDSEYEE